MRAVNFYLWHVTDVSYGSHSEGHYEARCSYCGEAVVKGGRNTPEEEVAEMALGKAHWCAVKVER